MRQLFIRIYGAILLSILFVMVASYYSLQNINEYRYQQHIRFVMQGSVGLLIEGVSRQQGEKQERWLSLASSLMSATVRTEPASIPQHEQDFVLTSEKQNDGRYLLIKKRLPNNTEQLVIEFTGVTEDVLTATSFLALNEIGRYEVNDRQAAFDKLASSFSFPIYRASVEQLILDSRQIDRLARGEPIVMWDKQFDQELAVNVYSPWGDSGDVLAMGPIPFFDPYPNHIVASVVAAALLFIALSVLMIIQHLSKRLHQLQERVDAISPSDIPFEQDKAEPDAIEDLNVKIQNMAKRIEKLVGEKVYMISAVSHDLRTPIAKLQFRLESLAVSLGDEHAVLAGCRKDLTQLNTLIDELLTYERLSVKHDIELTPTNVVDFVLQQMDGMVMLYPNLRFSLNATDQKTCLIAANSALLNRLFDNLLNNAAHYAKGHIQITLEQEKNTVHVHVDDDGHGLTAESIEQLFDPFFRDDKARTQHGGYGLGLAIVKKIAMQHNSIVHAANNEKGGARFTLSLPLLAPDSQSKGDKS